MGNFKPWYGICLFDNVVEILCCEGFGNNGISDYRAESSAPHATKQSQTATPLQGWSIGACCADNCLAKAEGVVVNSSPVALSNMSLSLGASNLINSFLQSL